MATLKRDRFASLETGIPMARLVSNQRSKNVAHARFIAMWLARNLTGQSLVQIGRNMGDRDHTTVLFAYRKIAAMVASNETMSEELRQLEKRIMADPRNTR